MSVIAESLISFKIKWKADNVENPQWNQHDQLVHLHETRIYPDPDIVKATGKAAYVKYRSAEQLNELLRNIGRAIKLKLGTDSYDILISADKLRFIDYESSEGSQFSNFQHMLSNNIVKAEDGLDNMSNIQVTVNGTRVNLETFGDGQSNLIVQIIPTVELSFQSKESLTRETEAAVKRSSRLMDFIRAKSELPEDAKASLLRELGAVKDRERKARNK